MAHLQLLSNFMIHTCNNMSLNQARQKVWQSLVPSLAARHEFLMYLLLALPGLDYFHPDGHFIPDLSADATSQRSQLSSTGSNHHLQLVVGHHQSEIQGFRSQLSDLSNSNCHEVFAGSLLLVAFAFASLRLRSHLGRLTSLHHAITEIAAVLDIPHPGPGHGNKILLVRVANGAVTRYPAVPGCHRRLENVPVRVVHCRTTSWVLTPDLDILPGRIRGPVTHKDGGRTNASTSW